MISDDAPELGIMTPSTKSSAPPIFIAPPPPEGPPPLAISESSQREARSLAHESPASMTREPIKTQSEHDQGRKDARLSSAAMIAMGWPY